MVSMLPPKLEPKAKFYYVISRKRGLNIYSSGLWDYNDLRLLGSKVGLLMFGSIDSAKPECGSKEVILELKIDSPLHPNKNSEGSYFLELDIVKEDVFYSFEGISVLRVFDSE